MVYSGAGPFFPRSVLGCAGFRVVAYHPVVVVAVGWIGIRYFVGSSGLLLPRIQCVIFRSPVFPVTRVLRWLCDCVVFCFAFDCVNGYFDSVLGVLFSFMWG